MAGVDRGVVAGGEMREVLRAGRGPEHREGGRPRWLQQMGQPPLNLNNSLA